jgi:peptidoglycan-N-acetylglucosamine deacetylase
MLNFLHRRGWSWYAAKTPRWLMWHYSNLLWRVKTKEKIVYLTFDDGPIPMVTEYVLDVLKVNNVKAHFFCIGKNVVANPEIYKRVLDEGHLVGNHTMHHVNGWKTNMQDYIKNVVEASAVIKSNLFRPPYGRITKAQVDAITNYKSAFGIWNLEFRISTIVMWDVLSGDFDTNITAEKCYQNVVKNIQPGSIIVFHDSEKAFPRMQEALPRVLTWLQQNEYQVRLLGN